ncbi:phosphonate C-P lyase system protein PhnG [Vibrio sp. D404a]|uniref:phosphonate C-P lyase system protein PhnG n=1 Tax=unclassified Vibrio TaxID=2614977 RepID=UPI002556B21A|nr:MULTISPECIES: phosphonate C-P lyase system protein PhnG [unclassified Vibrio]MDK9736996.1 phosphonate C-P lyase system protein PhnG [Vibrio sp. D404a]MDK9798143.1 phosphonate C-P lyase system protein PhnG [Vibrio sp. D449a]
MTALKERQKWMSVLAQSSFTELKAHWDELGLNAEYAMVRQPEIGLAQVRARMGSTGRQFNMGDVTITRAVIKLNSGELGYSYLQGRDKPHAELAAVIDALMQNGKQAEAINTQVIEPLAAMKHERDSQRRQEVAASKVDFFTMVRGED